MCVCVCACMVNSFWGLTADPVQMGGVGGRVEGSCAPGTSASVSPESSYGQEGGEHRGKEIKGEEMEH